MKKPILLIVGAAVILSAFITGFLFLRGNEDTWLCVEGQWVAHGHPSAPQPTTGCGQQSLSEISPTEITLPKIPNPAFDKASDKALQCTKQNDVNAATLPVLTKVFEEVKTRPCGGCDFTVEEPVCVEYIPKYTFGMDEVKAVENKLLFSGNREYDARSEDTVLPGITFGMMLKTADKELGVFYIFLTKEQKIIVEQG